jgi:hypothetical protein
MPKDLKPNILRLKLGDIRERTSGYLVAVVLKDKGDACLLKNINDLPSECNYHDEQGVAKKARYYGGL